MQSKSVTTLLIDLPWPILGKVRIRQSRLDYDIEHVAIHPVLVTEVERAATFPAGSMRLGRTKVRFVTYNGILYRPLLTPDGRPCHWKDLTNTPPYCLIGTDNIEHPRWWSDHPCSRWIWREKPRKSYTPMPPARPTDLWVNPRWVVEPTAEIKAAPAHLQKVANRELLIAGNQLYRRSVAPGLVLSIRQRSYSVTPSLLLELPLPFSAFLGNPAGIALGELFGKGRSWPVQTIEDPDPDASVRAANQRTATAAIGTLDSLASRFTNQQLVRYEALRVQAKEACSEESSDLHIEPIMVELAVFMRELGGPRLALYADVISLGASLSIAMDDDLSELM